MHGDGRHPTVIAEGIYHNINMTSRYVYFQEFQDDTTIYHSALGSSTYEVFQGAKDAAAQD